MKQRGHQWNTSLTADITAKKNLKTNLFIHQHGKHRMMIMIYLPTLAIDSPGLILLFLLLFFGLIALITFIIRRLIPGLKDKGGRVNEQVAVQQELDRVLEPITDEKILAEFEKVDKETKND